MTSSELRKAAQILRKQAQTRKTVKSAKAMEALTGLKKLSRFLYQ